jgi:hypothetical protein
VKEIENFGVPVRFHPKFQWPEERDYEERVAEAMALAEFSGRTSFICDITGQTIQPAEAAVVTPWEFRRSHLLELFRRNQEDIIAELILASDWSDWIVRRDLLQPQ